MSRGSCASGTEKRRRETMSKRNLSQQTAERLYNSIVAEGTLRPGDKLPNEVELSQQLGVSRATLREAIRELAPFEYVKAIQKDFDDSKIQYSDEYYEVTGREAPKETDTPNKTLLEFQTVTVEVRGQNDRA